MKVRNKKTGMIIDNVKLFTESGRELHSISELTEEWEDYEEFEGYFVDAVGNVTENSYADRKMRKKFCKQLKQIGNYFETKEEAEKAVEKLKAWKRLKDKGVSFEVKVIDRKWYLEPKAEPQQRTFDESHDLVKDIMFIFGGEE